MSQTFALPNNLPIPEDDGGCDHLTRMPIPSVSLPSTAGQKINLAELSGRVVIYCYPMTGRPGQALPDGWDEIPGARGCTPQSCAFRDHHAELQALQTEVFGLSTQTTDYQQEAVERLHLPFELLSDADLTFTQALKLPTMAVEGMILIKRTTLIVQEGVIEKVFYPVFPPDKNVDEVLAWLKQNPQD